MSEIHINNEIYIRRLGKLVVSPTHDNVQTSLHIVMSFVKEMERLGYTLSAELIEICQRLTHTEISDLYVAVVIALTALKGDQFKYEPMYPNFPDEVLSASAGELYFNAIVHYLSGGKLFPNSEKRIRRPFRDEIRPIVLQRGSIEDFQQLITLLTASTQGWSTTDKSDAAWFVAAYGEHIIALLPESIPSRENRASLAAYLLKHTGLGEGFVSAHLTTATDMLRLAAAMSGGDVSLAARTKFKSLPRRVRRLMLATLEAAPDRNEAFLKRREVWLRLAERLHPGEFDKRFPLTFESILLLRNDLGLPTFSNQVENLISVGSTADAAQRLAQRPGMLARRIDHLLRLDPGQASDVFEVFEAESDRITTPLLLQLRQHFINRRNVQTIRVAFPKGNTATGYVLPAIEAEINSDLVQRCIEVCEQRLMEKYAKLTPLGNVYIDPVLANFNVPFAVRSASRALRTVARGSRLPLPEMTTTLRLFLWWQNGRDRTDIDLSAVLYGTTFDYLGVIAYYNLKDYGACHSGDIVDAPNGASEFIDLPLQSLLSRGVRYVAMVVTSYTRQKFYELPECFAGWMARIYPGSGEIFEPKSVQDRLDLTSDKKIAIPVMFDLAERKAIWCDLALTANPSVQTHVQGNRASINMVLRSITGMKRPNLYDLYWLHAQSRGTLVRDPTEAQTVLSVENGTPFRIDEILAEWV